MYINFTNVCLMTSLNQNLEFLIVLMFFAELTCFVVSQVAPEEFHATLDYINGILYKSVPLNLKCLLFGCVCCPCTLGMSMGPVLFLNKRVCCIIRDH